MAARKVLFSIAAAVCFAAAYRFGSHGITLHDNQCIGLGALAIAVGLVLLWLGFRNKRPKHE